MSNIVYHGKHLTLFNIAKYMLGYEKITKDVHKEWCDNLEEVIKTRKRIMRLKPRGTYKTTIYDVSFVIDRLLDDYVKHDGKFTLRILITSATNDLAEQILSEIKEQLTKNENIKQFFTDFGNDNPISRDNQQEVVLNPRIVKKEPNLKARGALAALTSEHYDIIILDDVCFDDKTEVLTNNGWKLFKDLDKGVDLVATLNPETDEIEYQKPIRYIEKDYKGEMIGVNHPTIDFLVTPDHNMYFKRNISKNYKIEKVDDIYGMCGHFKKNGVWKGVNKEKIVLNEVRYRNNFIENRKEIDMGDFLEFLGFFIADGSVSSRFGINFNCVSLSQSEKVNSDKCVLIREILNKLPYKYIERKNKDGVIDFRIHSSQLANFVSQCGLKAREKKIPAFVKELSPILIRRFLDGFHMGDGSYNNHGSKCYYTSSKQLADDIQELIIKVGSTANVNSRITNTVNPTGKKYRTTTYNLTEFNLGRCEPFVSKKNWYKTDYDGKVYCVEVPNHVIYVRRNGKGLNLGQCNTQDRESVTVREQKKRWYKDLISILEPDGLLMVIGTRWSDDEIYGEIIEQNPKIPEFMRYDIEIDSIIDENGKPKYPSIYDEQKIQALRIEKGAVEFSSQYLNQPLPSETQLFKIDNLHYYTELKLPQERAQNPYFKDCKHVIYVDPALGNENDYCVIVVGAIKDHVLYVRDCWLSNTSPPNVSIEKMVYYYNFYNCEELGIETNGFQSLISQFLKDRNDKIKDMRKRMKIKEIKNQKRKRIRIESVEPFVTSGKVLFRDDWTESYPELINQLVRYPVHKHDDAPDALEGLVRMTINRGSTLIDKGTRSKRKFMIGINRRH
jgi:predicted phage terminase large subunit-like protein